MAASPPLRLVETVELVPATSGVRLVRGTRALRIGGPPDKLSTLLKNLRTGIDGPELTRVQADPILSQVLAKLAEIGWLTSEPASDDAASDDTAGAVSRQVGYLTLFGPDAQRMQARISAARVAIIGVGGIGGILAQHLAGAGVRELWIADHDRVAVHNLNRQFLFAADDVGTKKVAAAARALAHLAPGLTVTTWDQPVRTGADLGWLPAYLDLLAIAADTPPGLPGAIWEWARPAAVPIVTAAVGLGTGYWGPLIVPGLRHCWRCFERARTAALPPDDAAIEATAAPPTQYSFGPANTAIAAMLAHDVVRYLAAGDCATLNRRAFLHFDDQRLAFFDGGQCTCDGKGGT